MAFTGCQTTDPYTGDPRMNRQGRGALAGAVGGAALGAVIANNTGENGDAGRGALIGAAAGGLAGAGIGRYMDQQEAAIREQLRGSGVSVTRTGNDIILNMPHDITFAVDKDEIRPQFAGTLDSVALVLNKFDKTTVSVTGHTDSDGSESYNLELSRRRALAVSQYLSDHGVAPSRLLARGFGEAQPIASNATAPGKAQNRRVELHIVPRQ